MSKLAISRPPSYNILMYKRSQVFVAGYKFFIGLLALLAFIITIASFGAAAWRLFATFLLLLTIFYFFLSAAILLFDRQRQLDQNPCPMLEGLLIVAYLMQLGVILFYPGDTFADLPFLASALLYFLLPILIAVDQILINRKGAWHISYPFYWLSLPVTYAAWVILSAEFLPTDTAVYSLHFLNVAQVGIHDFLIWSSTFIILNLVLGFALYLADFIASGRLAKRIVLPHIRVVQLSEKELKS